MPTIRGYETYNGREQEPDPFNENLIWDVALQGKILGINENTPPVSSVFGDLWHIGSTPTGVWADNAGDFAVYVGGQQVWSYRTPVDGDGWMRNTATGEWIAWSDTAGGKFVRITNISDAT